MELYPTLYLLAVFTESIKGYYYEIAFFNFLNIRKVLNENIRQSEIFKHHIPVVSYGYGGRYHPSVM